MAKRGSANKTGGDEKRRQRTTAEMLPAIYRLRMVVGWTYQELAEHVGRVYFRELEQLEPQQTIELGASLYSLYKFQQWKQKNGRK